jgi:hypothetical protein
LSKTYQKLPGDEWFDNLDPLIRAYMFEHWLKDQEETHELERMNAILVGSFTNPEAARTMLKADNPDFSSTEEDFAKSLEMVEQDKEKFNQVNRRRKRRINKGAG